MTFGEPTESDFSPFDDAFIAAAEKIESLPHSASFEQVMYDHCQERTTSYESAIDGESPLEISRSSMAYAIAPYDICCHFPGKHLKISSLSAEQVIAPDIQDRLQWLGNTSPAMMSTVIVKCTINDVDFLFEQTSDSPMRIKFVTEYNGIKELELSEEVNIKNVLAMCIFAISDNDSLPYLEEDRVIKRPHDENGFESNVERLLLTLGALSGQVTTTTKSTFPLGENLGDASLTATMKYRETPRQNQLDTSLASLEIQSDELTKLFQNITNQPNSQAERWAEIGKQADIPWIIRSSDPGWLQVCTAFHAMIGPLLLKYEQGEESS